MSGIRVRVNIGSIDTRILRPPQKKKYSDATYGWHLDYLSSRQLSGQGQYWQYRSTLGLSTLGFFIPLTMYFEATYGWLVFPSGLDYLIQDSVCVTFVGTIYVGV